MVTVLFVAVVVTFYITHHHQSTHPYEVYQGGIYVPGLVRLFLFVIWIGGVQILGCTRFLVGVFGVSFDATSCSVVGR